MDNDRVRPRVKRLRTGGKPDRTSGGGWVPLRIDKGICRTGISSRTTAQLADYSENSKMPACSRQYIMVSTVFQLARA